MEINMKVVINELHKAFNVFNREFYGGKLPTPIIIVQTRGNKKNTLGWCTVYPIWQNDETKEQKYEINIVAETLNRGIYKVISTLLHEMVHLHNLINGIKDTSRGGTYHNTKFKEVAENHGLIIEYDTSIGHSPSKLNNISINLLEKSDINKNAFKIARMETVNISKKNTYRKYVCPGCGANVRATKKTFIICKNCMLDFIEEKDEDEDEDE